MDIQALLPEGWMHADIRSYGVVVTAVVAGQEHGSVTIDKEKRGFILGIAPIRECGAYAGRGWKASLYRDAVKALQKALARHESKRNTGN